MRYVVCLAALIGGVALLGAPPASAGPVDGPPSGAPAATRAQAPPEPSGPTASRDRAGSPGRAEPPAGFAGVSPSRAVPLARAVVLAASQGAAISPMSRVVVLQCTPMVGGTHPRSRAACAALGPVNGDIGKFKPSKTASCPLIYSPVTMTSAGVWDGRFVLSSQTFGNGCLLRSALGDIAGF